MNSSKQCSVGLHLERIGQLQLQFSQLILLTPTSASVAVTLSRMYQSS